MIKDFRPTRIDGATAYIPLTRGYEAVVDVDDIPLLDGRHWHAVNAASGLVYAVNKANSVSIYMHRLLLSASPGIMVDHADRNGLNNTRQNLRLATNSQNQFNQGLKASNTSGFKGVSFHKGRQSFTSRIMVDRKHVFLGYHATAEGASMAYAIASSRLHGDFGRFA